MGYIGKVPADVLIDPHVDSAAITDGTIVTADIANDAVTSAKLAANSVDSSELIDGSVDNSHLAGSIAINKTLLAGGTGLTLSTNTLNVDAAQSQITSVGTLSSLTLGGDLTLPQKIVHSGDTDTYLSFGTDSLSLYTGGTNVVSFEYGNVYIKQNNKALTGYTTGGGAKELIKIDSSDVVQIGEGQDTTFSGLTKTTKLFESAGGSGGQQAFSSSVTSSYRGGGLIRFFTDNNVSIFKLGNENSPYGGFFGTFAGYSPTGAELMILGIDGVNIGKNRNSEAIGLRCSTEGTLQTGAGAINTTNASNWQFISKSTTGGTISSTDGAGYFALGDNYTTAGAILMVRNDGNRGSHAHASGSSLFKASFNDSTAFEITKDGMIKGMQGASARIAGNWEVVDVVSAKNNSYGHIQSDNCFNDNIYSQFKIIIPYINCDTQQTTLLLSLLYNSGSGLTEDTGDYYVSMDLSPHNTSSYQGGTQASGTRAQIFGAMHSNTAVGVSGHIDVYETCIADLRQYNQFSANTMRSGDGNMDNDRGANYRPMMNCELMGYNEDHNAYTKQTTIVRANTGRHASYWKGFRLQCSSGNIGSGSQVIVLGRAL